MHKKLIFAIPAAVVFILGAAFVLWPRAPKSDPGRMESITVGSAALESSALLYIAEDRGLFPANGLSAAIRGYDTGASAFDVLLRGEIDIAVPAEYPLIAAAFKREQVSAIASIDKASYFSLIGRKDRGITAISNLKGKKIGVVRRTIAEFYLGRFLELNGINIGQVTLVDVSPSRSEDVIINGDVDAIISRPPYTGSIEQRLGVNGVIWPAQSGQALYAILVVRNDWIATHPERVKRLLRSLAQAEEYLIRHPAEARAILRKKLNLSIQDVTRIWSENQFFLSLDQSLILALEDEARWMIKNNLTQEKQTPDFLDYVYEDGLKAIKPEVVNILR